MTDSDTDTPPTRSDGNPDTPPLPKRPKRSRGLFTRLKNLLLDTVTGKIVALIWVMFLLQFVIYPLLYGPVNVGTNGETEVAELWQDLFVLQVDSATNIWTYFTSMFSHGGLLHAVVNTVVFISFGVFVEKDHSAREFIGLFLYGGLCASISQLLVTTAAQNELFGLSLAGNGVTSFLGASGAIAAIIGVAALKSPNDSIYLFFLPFLELSSFYAILLFAIGSLLAIVIGGVGVLNTAHTAHLGGLLAGVAWGVKRYGVWRVRKLIRGTIRSFQSRLNWR